ncbi:microfibril-associated glycoprotein 4-like [Saccoglossus kowalevskii]|uniref:Fibrinogen C domain-containing protein 1-B-like n=1 Tax=Saccoglossus kowalevskii TaxID=10224 RepID=A0ABM0GX43_SACKO|nr:PREDICTED: fibrinogen C domain-containing protein 1-B-like [Saccoglossus kowalevskii]
MGRPIVLSIVFVLLAYAEAGDFEEIISQYTKSSSCNTLRYSDILTTGARILDQINERLETLDLIDERLETVEDKLDNLSTGGGGGEVHVPKHIITSITDCRGGSIRAYSSPTGKDCFDIQQKGGVSSGIYTIQRDGDPHGDYPVYCDMDTDGGGWTVFHERYDGSVDFYQGWNEYKHGFGSVRGEYWLGNHKIHAMTNQGGSYKLRVDLEDFDGNTAYAAYDNFALSDEASGYTLSVGQFSGTAGDSLTYHSGLRFITHDLSDVDTSCAVTYHGAWWYRTCHYSNLNGKYLGGETAEYATGDVWYHWKGYYYSAKCSEMKVKPM